MEAELGNRVQTAAIDVTDKEALVKLLKGADIAISTVGPFYKYATMILKAAIEAHVNIVDIDDDFDATKDSWIWMNPPGRPGSRPLSAWVPAPA